MGCARDGVDVAVVGSGPNGLVAAALCARAGLSVLVFEEQDTLGGGARTLDLGLTPAGSNGTLVHDVCSAVHPMALASPVFRQFDLAARGVRFAVPDVSYAQPLDFEASVLAYRDIERTSRELGADASRWTALLSPLSESPEAVDAMLAAALGDKRSIPGPLRTFAGAAVVAHFGVGVLAHGSLAWNLPFHTGRARALFTGVASHAIAPLPSLATAGSAVMLAALGHASGWPVPVGGSQSIADALIEDCRAHGVVFETGRRIEHVDDLPHARAVLLDTSADAAAALLSAQAESEPGDGEQGEGARGEEMLGTRGRTRHGGASARMARSLLAMGHRAAAAKVDFVLNAPVPWSDPATGLAGTVHVGGSRTHMREAEAAVARGEVPSRPVVLVSDPAIFDPTRAVRGPGGETLRPLWSYAHMPLGSTADPAELVIRQIERFAPGFRRTIVAVHATPASAMHLHNSSLVGGDIAHGSVSMYRMIARPTPRWDPYRLGAASRTTSPRTAGKPSLPFAGAPHPHAWKAPALYLCSAATPPGPGVHGLSGYFAASRALRDVFGLRAPSLAP